MLMELSHVLGHGLVALRPLTLVVNDILTPSYKPVFIKKPVDISILKVYTSQDYLYHPFCTFQTQRLTSYRVAVVLCF